MTKVFGNFFRKKNPLKIVGMVTGGILLAGLMAFLFGWVVMLLWNWLMPGIFGLGTITYWQGFGIFFLAKILFGFGGEHSGNINKHKKKEQPVRNKIHKEFDKDRRDEVKKEFEKEFNGKYDEKYEKWWSEEGKDAFDNYMNNNKEPEA